MLKKNYMKTRERDPLSFTACDSIRRLKFLTYKASYRCQNTLRERDRERENIFCIFEPHTSSFTLVKKTILRFIDYE